MVYKFLQNRDWSNLKLFTSATLAALFIYLLFKFLLYLLKNPYSLTANIIYSITICCMIIGLIAILYPYKMK